MAVPRKQQGKENPKGREVLAILQVCEQKILDQRGLPRCVPDSMRDLWEKDVEFCLRIWVREIRRLDKLTDGDEALACSAFLQGYLKMLEIIVPSGVFKADLQSLGGGRKPTFDASPLVQDRDLGYTYGKLGMKYHITAMRARDRVKSAKGRLSRSSPLDGVVFDQICRMFGVMPPEEQIEDYIRRVEAGEFKSDPDDESLGQEPWTGKGFAPG